MAMHYFYEWHSNFMSRFLDRIPITEQIFGFPKLKTSTTTKTMSCCYCTIRLLLHFCTKNIVHKYDKPCNDFKKYMNIVLSLNVIPSNQYS